MKTLLKITIVAILAFFAFSCKKEEPIVYKTFDGYGAGIQTLSENDLVAYYDLHLYRPIYRMYYNSYYPYRVIDGEFSVSDTFYNKGSYWKHTQNYMLDSAVMTSVTVHGQDAMLTISGTPELSFVKDVQTDVHVLLKNDWKWQDRCFLPIGWNKNTVTIDIHTIMYAHTTDETNTKID